MKPLCKDISDVYNIKQMTWWESVSWCSHCYLYLQEDVFHASSLLLGTTFIHPQGQIHPVDHASYVLVHLLGRNVSFPSLYPSACPPPSSASQKRFVNMRKYKYAVDIVNTDTTQKKTSEFSWSQSETHSWFLLPLRKMRGKRDK